MESGEEKRARRHQELKANLAALGWFKSASNGRGFVKGLRMATTKKNPAAVALGRLGGLQLEGGFRAGHPRRGLSKIVGKPICRDAGNAEELAV